jgi:DNA-binding transcriptional MerR regulator
MNYTIKKLAELTGTTPRTVRLYDQIGLLKPAFIAENGYRYYGDAQVITLQQIILYKELGISLKQIKDMLAKSDLSYEETLLAQKKVLTKNISKQKKLLRTLEMMLLSIEKAKTMPSAEVIEEYTDSYKERVESIFNRAEIESIKESEESIKQTLSTWRWVEDWTPYLAEAKKIQGEFEKKFDEGLSIDSAEVQLLARKNFEHGKKAGITTKEAVVRPGILLRDKFYQEKIGFSYELGCYIADAMDYFANKNL